MAVIIIFGIPGSGKSTHAASVVWHNLKHGIKTYSNVDILGSVRISKDEIGKYAIQDGDLILDEASIEYNNRNYKSLPLQTIEWFKKYRHEDVGNIYIYSQSYEDMDVTLRRLADHLYIIRRSLPGLFVLRRINRSVDIDKETRSIIDAYFFGFLGIKFLFGFRYWHMFDSYEKIGLPPKKRKYFGLDYADDINARTVYVKLKLKRKENSKIRKALNKIKSLLSS